MPLAQISCHMSKNLYSAETFSDTLNTNTKHGVLLNSPNVLKQKSASLQTATLPEAMSTTSIDTITTSEHDDKQLLRKRTTE